MPCFGLLFGVIVVQVVPANFGSTQQMVLAAVNNLQADPQLLHQGCSCTAQVVRCPFTFVALAQHQRVVMMTTSKRLAAVLETALPVTDQLADRLGVDVAFLVLAGEAERGMAGFFFQALELVQRE